MDYIHYLVSVKSYKRIEIDKTFKKHIEKKRRSQMSTFFDVPKDEKLFKRIAMPYSQMSLKFDNIFSPKSTKNFKSLLGSNKDDILMLKKSGIHEEQCQNGCDAVYYEKTIRNVEKRFKEHINQFNNGNQEKSSQPLY